MACTGILAADKNKAFGTIDPRYIFSLMGSPEVNEALKGKEKSQLSGPQRVMAETKCIDLMEDLVDCANRLILNNFNISLTMEQDREV
jgi:hypothetical protein